MQDLSKVRCTAANKRRNRAVAIFTRTQQAVYKHASPIANLVQVLLPPPPRQAALGAA